MTTGWKDVAIGEVAEIQSGNSISKSRKEAHFVDVQDGMPYVATKDISFDSNVDYDNGVSIPHDEIDNFRIAKKGDVLICAEGGSAGRKIGLLDRDVCFVNKLFRVHLESQGRWLFYVFQGRRFQGQFKENLAGLIGGVSKSKFKSIRIPIPPLEEQERIVEVLDEAFAAIDKAKANIERNLTNARELFQSRLNDIFSNPSEDWEVKPLGEVCDFQNGFAFKSKWYSDSGTRVIRIGDIQDDSVVIQEARCVQESSIDDDFGRYVIPNGAILIAMSGATTGKIGVFEHRTRALLNQRVGCIKPLPEIKQRFLWNFMKFYSDGYLAISAGSAQPNLSTKQICSTPIPIPAFEEQDRICGKLDELAEMTEALEAGYQTELDNLEELRQSILEQAFEGKLTETVAV